MKSGIYLIQNIINKKVYVGSSVNIERRWKKHKALLRNDKHHSLHLQNAWNKFGEENFKFIILETVKVLSHLLAVEQVFLDYYKSYEKEFGYNYCKTAGSPLGMKLSKEHRRKLSEANKGKKHSEETKEKIRIAHIGKKHTDESKEKMSEYAKKRKYSEETRAKMSDSKKGKNNHRYGETHKEEVKTKISNSNRKPEKHKGYSFHKGKNKYQVTISIRGKKKYLGSYDTKEEARAVYLKEVANISNNI
jgi:group I intron endonuclease